MNKPIQLTNVGLTFPTKTCFEDFTTHIHPGSRIAIIGPNGCGKTSLLKILQGDLPCSEGSVNIPAGTTFGYVQHTIDHFDQLSGGERVITLLNQVLANDPDVLLLDEPTNHLDQLHRQSLIRAINRFTGTIIMVSHDPAFIHACGNIIWHIEDKKVHVFMGSYDNYRKDLQAKREALEMQLDDLKKAKKDTHIALMKEQIRAKHSRQKGEKSIDQHKWPTIVSDAKARRGEETSGSKRQHIRDQRQHIQEQLDELKMPAVISPTFSITAAEVSNKSIVSISQGTLGYEMPILDRIYFDLAGNERIGIVGKNGAGKSTFIKGILGDAAIQIKTGNWFVPKRESIGYMDQHYGTLDPTQTVWETLRSTIPQVAEPHIRQLLSTFLFYSDRAVATPVAQLSGGEKVRLCLAQIAAKTPPLLILDEVTNNLDLPTREHMIQVLMAYPGAIIAISHDVDFLASIGITELLDVSQWKA
jgi:ATPase subunit of ABC transporter with duplicated ATPase domains